MTKRPVEVGDPTGTPPKNLHFAVSPVPPRQGPLVASHLQYQSDAPLFRCVCPVWEAVPQHVALVSLC
jgi:hypothetical protein